MSATSAAAPADVTVTWSTNWMSGIADESPISEISIPGTHDSTARVNLANAQCQWYSITDQLCFGIRFLDIRCKYVAAANDGQKEHMYFPIYHGSVFSHVMFEEVQAQCIAFLATNPSECILMNVQREEAIDSQTFEKKFAELTAAYQDKWYLKPGGTIPKLAECRGRIVLIRAGWGNAIGGLLWNGYKHNGESQGTIFRTQNGWNSWSKEEKRDKVLEYTKDAEQHGSQITLNFASFSNSVGPGGNAQYMNDILQKFLKDYRPGGKWGVSLGVIIMDFIGNTGIDGHSLENLIIEHQRHQRSDVSYGGLPMWLRQSLA